MSCARRSTASSATRSCCGARRTLTEQQRDGLAIIERSGEHLLTLVNDLLDLAKIEAGRLELRDESIDLESLLQHVTDLIRVRADKAGLRFAVERPPALPQRIRGDARALRQVLLNLLGNAVKFTDAGGSVAAEDRAGRQPLAISDLRFRYRHGGRSTAEHLRAVSSGRERRPARRGYGPGARNHAPSDRGHARLHRGRE